MKSPRSVRALVSGSKPVSKAIPTIESPIPTICRRESVSPSLSLESTAMKAGANGYIHKPFRGAELMDLVSQLKARAVTPA